MSDSLPVRNVNFKISKQDTLGPALVSAFSENRTQVTLRFDEILADGTASLAGNFKIASVKRQDSLQVVLAYVNPIDSLEVRLRTAEQAAGTDYRIMAQNLTDLTGNPIDAEFRSDSE